MRILRSTVRFGTAVMAACALLAVGITPATAAPDVSPPVVVSHTVTQTTVDVTNAPASLTFRVRITDETQVSDFVARIRHTASGQSSPFSPEELVSGSLQNGVWRMTATIPKGSAAGNWVIDIVQLTDANTNATNAFLNLRTIVVRSVAPDVSPPVVVSQSVSKTTLDVTNAAALLTLDARITDQTAVSDFAVQIQHAGSGQYHYFLPEKLVSGTAQDGVWRASVTIPKGSAAGKWVISILALKDSLTNPTNAFMTIRTIAVKSATPDLSPPAIISHTVSKTALDVTNTAASVTLSVRISDQTAVSGFTVSLRHPESRQAHYPTGELVSGTVQNGVWRATATIPKGSPAGAWILSIHVISDTLVNQTNAHLRTINVKSAA